MVVALGRCRVASEAGLGHFDNPQIQVLQTGFIRGQAHGLQSFMCLKFRAKLQSVLNNIIDTSCGMVANLNSVPPDGIFPCGSWRVLGVGFPCGSWFI